MMHFKFNSRIKNKIKIKNLDFFGIGLVIGMADMISYDDFAKLDLRTAKIVGVEEIPRKDKLYKLSLEVGNEKRTIVAGLKPFYSKEQLLGKTIIIIANLQPRMLGGIESQGMLLAADQNGGAILLVPDKMTESGLPIK